MKPIPCPQRGGPCALPPRGETHDDVINTQDQHLKAMEKAGDAAHQPARDEMKKRWRRPRKALGWYNEMKQTFAALPVD